MQGSQRYSTGEAHRRRKNSLSPASLNVAVVCAALQDHAVRKSNKLPASRDPRRHLTLAQKLNLVKRPPTPLSEEKWLSLRQQAIERQYYDRPCVICHQPFQKRKQAVLSCGHVFHVKCIVSFERFSRTRQCPLCRVEDYERIQCEDGKKLWQHKAAVTVQACFRGRRCRQETLRLLRSDPKSILCYSHLMRSLELRTAAYEVVRLEMRRKQSFNEVLAHASAAMKAARTMRERVAERDAKKTEAKRSEPSPQCRMSMRKQEKWGKVLQKYQTRAEQHEKDMLKHEVCCSDSDSSGDDSDFEAYSCAICLESVAIGVVQQLLGEATTAIPENPRPVALLSCAHAFHARCIDSFERFQRPSRVAIGSWEQAIAHSHRPLRCPLCRQRYQKLVAGVSTFDQ